MRTTSVLAVLGLAMFASACARQPVGPRPVDTQRIVAADQEPGSWLTHGRTYGEERFSPLTQIDASNVGKLGLAWAYELKTARGASATPLVVDGVMFVTSAWSLVYALDAKTGRERWVYDPAVDRAVGANACCDVVNRGVAVYGGKVYVGVTDGRLTALNATDGSVVWEKMTVDPSQPYTITGAPRAANGLVFIGNGGAEYGVRGYVSAYDAATGDLRWRFYTVPGDPAKGPDHAASDAVMARAAQTWTGDWWKLGGGGTVWDAIVYDPDFDQVVIGVGNGSPWNQQLRSPGGGDNWFLSSIVALDAKTGVYKWHYQTTPGDTWDFTATQPIILTTITIEGAPRKVAMQAPKNGFFYVIDRANGKLISAAPMAPMLSTANTPQGMPLSWAYAVDVKTGRPVENPEARYVGATALVRPSPFGAHNWHPMAFSPQTGLVYVPTQEVAFDFTTDQSFMVREGRWNTGTVHAALPEDPTIRARIREASTGALVAWDPVNQREAWRLAHKGPWNGGALATAGGLVFEGTADGMFLAIDAKTGHRLWEFDNQTATLAGPIAYTIDGEQYVSVLGGYGSVFFLTSAGALTSQHGAPLNGWVFAYKIGGGAQKPPISARKAAMEAEALPKPPLVTASAKDLEHGAALYGYFCMMCHGAGALSGGVIQDLRRSPRLNDVVAWQEAVVGGGLRSLGMPRFDKFMTAKDAELIRAYVARQATIAYSGGRPQNPRAASAPPR